MTLFVRRKGTFEVKGFGSLRLYDLEGRDFAQTLELPHAWPCLNSAISMPKLTLRRRTYDTMGNSRD